MVLQGLAPERGRFKLRVKWDTSAVERVVEKSQVDIITAWLTEDVMPDAIQNCPVDKGPLRASHKVVRKGNRVDLVAGGPSAPYADTVHDDPTAQHDIGEHHWLENAFNRQLGKLRSRQRAGMR
jgi:hypothetical protein